jgi:hypothetical protein
MRYQGSGENYIIRSLPNNILGIVSRNMIFSVYVACSWRGEMSRGFGE